MQHLVLLLVLHALQDHHVSLPLRHLSHVQLELSASAIKQAARLVHLVTSVHQLIRL
jgi:hypothetical protein